MPSLQADDHLKSGPQVPTVSIPTCKVHVVKVPEVLCARANENFSHSARRWLEMPHPGACFGLVAARALFCLSTGTSAKMAPRPLPKRFCLVGQSWLPATLPDWPEAQPAGAMALRVLALTEAGGVPCKVCTSTCITILETQTQTRAFRWLLAPASHLHLHPERNG